MEHPRILPIFVPGFRVIRFLLVVFFCFSVIVHFFLFDLFWWFFGYFLMPHMRRFWSHCNVFKEKIQGFGFFPPHFNARTNPPNKAADSRFWSDDGSGGACPRRTSCRCPAPSFLFPGTGSKKTVLECVTFVTSVSRSPNPVNAVREF